MQESSSSVDVLLVGAGIMSATLASLMTQLEPNFTYLMVEALEGVALESSDAWNNAGTGHAGFCELNYTPVHADGIVATRRALEINAAYETSLQYWSSLVEQGVLPESSRFINRVPHDSLVWGDDNVAFLKQRHARLSEHPLFAGMAYTESPSQLSQWMPLVMRGRDKASPLAATQIEYGTDVDFGALTRLLVEHLQTLPQFELRVHTKVIDLKKQSDGRWRVKLRDTVTKRVRTLYAKFVFLGAGGGALPLLQKSGIPEAKGYGGFPVSGQWLACHNPSVIQQHRAKVYGKAPLGAPPMSVPHLDTRWINGEQALLFGPYAGFTSRFLKRGSWLDLVKSVKPNNLSPMLAVSVQHTDLTRYLIGEVMQSFESRMQSLQQFYPEADPADWKLAVAGQRVQIIKRCEKNRGKLEFGTEIVSAQDGSLAALLGASPGASTSVQAMLTVIERCFTGTIQTSAWQAKLKALIPHYGHSLVDAPERVSSIRERSLRILNLV